MRNLGFNSYEGSCKRGIPGSVTQKVYTTFTYISPLLRSVTNKEYQNENSEKKLKNLRVEQLKKVEEMKKKTNYYSTKTLLDRYDASPADSPLRLRPVQGMMQVPPATPQRVAFSDSNRPDGRGPSQVQAQTPQTSSSSTSKCSCFSILTDYCYPILFSF